MILTMGLRRVPLPQRTIVARKVRFPLEFPHVSGDKRRRCRAIGTIRRGDRRRSTAVTRRPTSARRRSSLLSSAICSLSVAMVLWDDDLHDAPHSGGTCNGGNDTEQAERPAAGYQRHDAADSGHGNAVTTLVKRHIALLNQLRACGGYAGHARLNLVGRRSCGRARQRRADRERRCASLFRWSGSRMLLGGSELLSRAILSFLLLANRSGCRICTVL